MTIPIYDFRPILGTPAFDKLKAWIKELPDCYVQSFVVVEDGALIMEWGAFEQQFEPTLLPYFFDSEGLIGSVIAVTERENGKLVNGFAFTVSDKKTSEFLHIIPDRKPERPEANHACWDECFILLNQQLEKEKV
jgi:hypothetical protein